MNEEQNIVLPFDAQRETPRIIKVVGVGGGGSNAVENMYKQGIHNVSFAICNTDMQALMDSNIPVKVQLGEKITEGLGAGNNPERASAAAEESRKQIEALFTDGTKMAFVTAGMGGGTGTGAAPVVASIAKSMDILTIGIVTIPFKFELKSKILQALKGVTEMAKHVDALLVINNQRLLSIYPQLDIEEGFKMVDEVLTTATKSIAEIITARGKINLDFRDVEKVLKNGGVAIMSYGTDSGEQRVAKAFRKALHSPLLNDNDIYKSKKLLFNIYYNPNTPMKVVELEEVDAFMEQFTNERIEVIWGVSKDSALAEGEVKVTVLATGFGMSNIPGMEPVIKQEELEKEIISREEKEKEEKEKRRLEDMQKAFYKQDYRVYIFTGDEINDENFIATIDNSPTYKRTSRELEQIKSIVPGFVSEQQEKTVVAETTATQNEEELPF
ncbi:MAG: cell division protein FtsZ [Bacteroidaceae bacterium]|nr:cell division protein FtsZ [Bacteroidaceae bacterium]